MKQNAFIGKTAVLGAGVMGAQIAAHLANAGVPVVLFELAGEGTDKSAPARNALKAFKKLKPAPLASQALLHLITPANYDTDLVQLQQCDLIIEAIAERMEWKQDLYEKIAPYVREDAILASNTSGLGIEKLSSALPTPLRSRFLGVHFFNPPRYMHLVEVIPTAQTDPNIMSLLEPFFVSTLGKGVVYAKDTANFIGNRVGVFSILSVMHYAIEYKIPFDVVDKLTGVRLGRPKSGTFRTADVVGLDTLNHVINTMHEYLPDDPWHHCYQTPDFIRALVDKGAMGQKTGAGIYIKKGKQAFDPFSAEYVDATGDINPDVQQILSDKNLASRCKNLRESNEPQAQFIWSILRDLFHYCCYWLGDIADTARDIDFAIRWGYAWQQGPFELMQACDWQETVKAINEDIAAGKCLSNAPMPNWTTNIDAIHQLEGSYSAADQCYKPLSDLPVYQRQVQRENVLGSENNQALGTTLFENEAARAWTVDDGIVVLSFKTKLNTINNAVLDAVQHSCDIAESEYQALVIWNGAGPFSAGANLKEIVDQVLLGNLDAVESTIEKFQQASMRLKHCSIPTVAAVSGLALGGGCEFQMHCDLTVSALETYTGLVEAGVGLIPAGGGLKELALKAVKNAAGKDLQPYIQDAFELVAMGKTSSSAIDAQDLGLLKQQDVVICHQHEILHVAKAQATAMVEAGYRPQNKEQTIPVLGKTGKASLMMMAVNMREGHFISEHDYAIAERIADCLCGGDVESGSTVSQDWLLKLERDHFLALLQEPKTHARIEHMLKTNKPLRN